MPSKSAESRGQNEFGITKLCHFCFNHPCFYGSARRRWGRIHLPVAPKCNIQCNFCNRKYDCANESRPAVTNHILEPGDVVSYLSSLLQARSDISVVGIAGPGDPLRTATDAGDDPGCKGSPSRFAHLPVNERSEPSGAYQRSCSGRCNPHDRHNERRRS